MLYSEKPFVICLPVYVSYLPPFIEKYLKTQKFAGNRKVYFVFTSGGGHSGAAGAAAEKIFTGKNMIFMGYSDIRMPNNYMVIKFIPAPTEEKIMTMLKEARFMALKTAYAIAHGKRLHKRYITYAEKIVTKGVSDLYTKFMQPTRKFYTTDKCIGCGKCASVCPLNIIEMKNSRPMWKTPCAHCMSCIGNCPVEAIEYGKVTLDKNKYNIKRYIGKNRAAQKE